MTPELPDDMSVATSDMLYLASPYSHVDAAVRHERFVMVCRAVAALLRQGQLVFSPIAHSHPVALHGELDGEWSVWRDMDMWFLSRCQRFAVLTLPGWQYSVGVNAEMTMAREQGKAIDLLDPWHLLGDSSVRGRWI